MLTIFRNAVIFDGFSAEPLEPGYVIVEDGFIREVGTGAPGLSGDRVLDLGGRFLMPGLIDAHFHAYSITFDMRRLDDMTLALKVAHAARLLRGALYRGFTTVRDPAGGEIGLQLAIDEGLFEGPRYFHGGKALSQTGGHGDMRPADQRDDLCGCASNATFAEIVDGVDAVRRFCRNELRKGADHIKVFISGGVASPTDPVWMPQYTDAELSAAVEEAASRRKYVIAHCHTDDGARRCLATGVRSIDHCTLITPETAAALAAADGETYAVPTLAVMEQALRHGEELGMFPDSLAKVRAISEQAYQSLEYLQRCGARIGFGTDLFEERFHPMQSREFEFRADVIPALDQLRSVTSVNAEIMKKSGQLGCIAPGAHADLLVLDGNPLQDIMVMTQPERNFAAIVKGGEFVTHRL